MVDGPQYEMGVAVYPTPGWYWIWQIDEWIGAVRGDFYEASGLLHGGTLISWYGEVNDPDDGVASKSEMGSGRFANAGFGRAAYMAQLSTYTRNPDQSIGATNPYAPTTVTATDSACYSVLSDTSNPANVVIWAGGPGWNNTTCKTD